jgi:hypothetical protein
MKRNLVLEYRIAKLEKLVESRIKNERGLLRGIVGKTDANKEDSAKAIDAFVKLTGIDPERISKASGFNFTVTLYSEPTDNVEPGLDPEVICDCYVLNVKDTDDMKIVATLKAGKVKFKYKNGSADKVGNSEFAVKQQMTGLTLASYDRLAKNLESLFKKQGLNVKELKDSVEISKSVDELLLTAKNKYANSIIDLFENDNSVIKNVKWMGWRDDEIRGDYHIKYSSSDKVIAAYRININLKSGLISKIKLPTDSKNSSEDRRFDDKGSLVRAVRDLVLMNVKSGTVVEPGYKS